MFYFVSLAGVSSSLPEPQRTGYTGAVRQSSSLNENSSSSAARNYLHLHDIRLPPDMEQPPQVSSSRSTIRLSNVPTVDAQGQLALPQTAQQQDPKPRHRSTGHIQPSGPSRRRAAGGPGSWPHEHQRTGTAATAESNNIRYSTSEPTKVPDSSGGTTRQSPRRSAAFIPRSPNQDEVVNQPPFESSVVKGPPTIEYGSQSQTRYVEGASQMYIVEDHVPTSQRRGAGVGAGHHQVNPPPPTHSQSAQVQNFLPVSCSDEMQRRGSRDQVVVVPSTRHPQEGVWIDPTGGGGGPSPREELATGREWTIGQGSNQGHLPHHQSAFIDPQQQQQIIHGGGRRTPPQTQMSCPVCQKVFPAGTKEEIVNTHVNVHFDEDRNVPGDFEVLQ